MIQNETLVRVVDNTGAKTAKVIRILKGSNAKYATVWDMVVVAIKSANAGGMVSKWDVSWAVVVRTRREIPRKDWTYLRFEDNAVALIEKNKNPKWKRIFGPVARELREKGFANVATMAEDII